MGNYASVAELKARFEDDEEVANLTDTSGTGTPDSAVLNEVLNDSEGLIDSSVGMRYLIPVVVADDTVLANRLKSLTLDLSVHRLLRRGGIESEIKQRANDEALEYLKNVREGLLVLPSAATIASTNTRDTLISYGTAGTGDNSQRLFSRGTQDGI